MPGPVFQAGSGVGPVGFEKRAGDEVESQLIRAAFVPLAQAELRCSGVL